MMTSMATATQLALCGLVFTGADIVAGSNLPLAVSRNNGPSGVRLLTCPSSSVCCTHQVAVCSLLTVHAVYRVQWVPAANKTKVLQQFASLPLTSNVSLLLIDAACMQRPGTLAALTHHALTFLISCTAGILCGWLSWRTSRKLHIFVVH